MTVKSSLVHVRKANFLLASFGKNRESGHCHSSHVGQCRRRSQRPISCPHSRGFKTHPLAGFAKLLAHLRTRVLGDVNGDLDRPRLRMGSTDKKHIRGTEWSSEGLNQLKERLRAYKAQQLSSLAQKTPNPDSAGLEEEKKPSKKASVLVLLFQGPEKELRVLLTERSKGLSSHGGEVALPGGKQDPTDADEVAAALREAQEEVGLDPENVEVLTTFEPFLSKHMLLVTPVIGSLIDPEKFIRAQNPGEVETIFDAPLEMFLKNEGHRDKDVEMATVPFRLHFFDYHDGKQCYNIWGLTASILIRIASVVFDRAPEFEEFHPAIPSYREILIEMLKRNLLVP